MHVVQYFNVLCLPNNQQDCTIVFAAMSYRHNDKTRDSATDATYIDELNKVICK